MKNKIFMMFAISAALVSGVEAAVAVKNNSNGVPGNISAKYQRLVAEKQRKMEQLEKCTGDINGWKIAGISTLGLTAVGVAGNVVLANKKSEFDKKIEQKDKDIEKTNDNIIKKEAEKAEREEKAEKDKPDEQTTNKKQPETIINQNNDCIDDAKRNDSNVVKAVKNSDGKCEITECSTGYKPSDDKQKCEEETGQSPQQSGTTTTSFGGVGTSKLRQGFQSGLSVDMNIDRPTTTTTTEVSESGDKDWQQTVDAANAEIAQAEVLLAAANKALEEQLPENTSSTIVVRNIPQEVQIKNQETEALIQKRRSTDLAAESNCRTEAKKIAQTKGFEGTPRTKKNGNGYEFTFNDNEKTLKISCTYDASKPLEQRVTCN